MTTPIIMLALMVAPFVVYRSRAAGAAGLGLLFFFTGSGHFLQTEAMAQMLAPWVPAPVALVYLTGVLEFALAIAFFIPETRRSAGWMAAALLVLFFLMVRAPLQLAILAWVYWFTIRLPRGRHPLQQVPTPV